jgi:hypothetical protein
MINAEKFPKKWERQRARGRWVYALIHAAVIGGMIGLLKLVINLTGMEGPDSLTLQSVLYFAMGGFAYGLIRFSIRERFYQALKGQSHDGS